MSQARGALRTAHTVYFKNAYLIDGTGAEPRLGGLVVQDDRITDVGRIDLEPDGDRAEVIDLGGRALLPGLVLGHVHLSYHKVKEQADVDLRQPPEVAAITAVGTARTLLDCGVTAALSAGAPHLVDVHVRNAVNAGQVPGPRLLAAGRDICQTGGMLDAHPSWLRLEREGFAVFADGPWEVRRAVRRLVKDGADLIKMYVTGEGLLLGGGPPEPTCTQDEVDAMADEAHRRRRLCSVHARTAEGCRMAARARVDLIDHATRADDQALDAIAEAGCFLVPALDSLVSTLEHARQDGFAHFASYNDFLDRTNAEEELDAALETIARARKRGIRVLAGGDFGCAWCPHGTYGRELTHLVHLSGYAPMDALVAATRLGAEAMRLQDRIGTLQRGKLADLIVVEGNPLHDITLLEDRKNLSYVMKGGRFFRRPVPEPAPAYV